MALLANSLHNLLGSAASEMLAACPDLLTLQRPTVTVGAMGGTVYDWDTATTVARNVPCNLQNVSPRESEQFSRRGLTISNKVFVPQDLDARLGDRVTVNSAAGVYFTVTFISDMGGEHAAFKLYLNQVQ